MAYFLLVVSGGIDPDVRGPFRTMGQLKDAAVAEYRQRFFRDDEDGMFPMRVTFRKGQPHVETWSFTGAEGDAFREQAERGLTGRA